MQKNQGTFKNIIVWSVITAAFIGPGTLTTAAGAGARFSYDLLWTVVFATVACLVLQEGAARLSILSGKDLGTLIRGQRGKVWVVARYLTGISVIFGCVAYQSGNVAGAVSGMSLAGLSDGPFLAGGLSALVFALLFTGNYKAISRVLTAMVALMGTVFLVTAFLSDARLTTVLQGLSPSLPTGSGLAVLGLIGTTIVPYNLFLGSGVGKGQGISDMRKGLAIMVLFGGAITGSVLITGAMVQGAFDFPSLAAAMEAKIGGWSVWLLAAGLFAAGFTSCVTAPLAAGFIARSIFGDPEKKNDRSYLAGWMIVVGAGAIVGMLGLRPIPLIILAQALNGLVLPLVAFIIVLFLNDRSMVGASGLNKMIINIITLMVLAIVTGIGLMNLFSAAEKAFGISLEQAIWPVTLGLMALAVAGTVHRRNYKF